MTCIDMATRVVGKPIIIDEKRYHDEWLVIEVLEENELGEPVKAK